MPVIKKQTARQVSPQVVSSAASAWDLVDSIRMLLYGRSGTGKTTLWATFPGPILALICSGGNKPGELRSINTPEYREKITPKIINSMDEFKAELAEAASYATVVLDHASGLADLILKEIMGIDDILISKYRQAGKGESWSVVSQPQYGQLAIQCKEYFRTLLNLPGNVVIIAQERTFGDETGSELIAPTIGPALTPSVVGWLTPACDYVVQTFIRPIVVERVRKVGVKNITTTERGKGVQYCLRTEPHELYMTKFRVPRGVTLPDVIVDPTYDKIKEIIEG